jgi:hypothetical protein
MLQGEIHGRLAPLACMSSDLVQLKVYSISTSRRLTTQTSYDEASLRDLISMTVINSAIIKMGQKDINHYHRTIHRSYLGSQSLMDTGNLGGFNTGRPRLSSFSLWS